MFQHVDVYPGDPILTLNESFASDPRPEKINLSIGVYLDDARRLPIMGAVLEAETGILKQIGTRPYLPMEGAPNYRKAAQLLLFGDDSAAVRENRIATVQTIGGSGALKVGADFLKVYFSSAQVWICNPSWDNHRSIFSGAGFQVHAYPYYSPTKHGVDFDAMKAALQAVPEGDIVLLHACCHNPTGADLTEQQWRDLVPVFRERRLIPFFDIAYQGFGDGIHEDAFAIRHFTAEGLVSLVASSFSKNFSLYGERCGSLNVVCPDSTQADNVLGQLKSAVRRNYSSPPTHGARIVATVLQDMRGLWEDELGAMRGRIKAMRSGLYSELHAARPDYDFQYLLRQKGMFSYTGLSQEQVRRLREEYGVYLIGSGRICIAALTQDSIAPVAEAIVKVLD